MGRGRAGGEHQHRDVPGGAGQHAGGREAQRRIEDDPQGRAPGEPGQAHRERGVVRPRRADPDEDGVGMSAPEVDRPVRHGAGDAQPLRAGPGGEAIGRARELEVDHGPPEGHAGDVAAMVAGRLLPAQPGLDGHARRPQVRVAPPGDAGIRIVQGGDDAGDPGGDDGIATGRRPAVMRAGLQRDEERRATGRSPGLGDGLGLGMGTPARRGGGGAEDGAGLRCDDHCADGGVGPRRAERPAAEGEREAHRVRVARHGLPVRRFGGGAGSGAGDSGGGSAEPASVPPSVPSRSSKSLASRKFL